MSGIWSWSRHPNYFGNAAVYWGCFLVALNNPRITWTIVSPLVITAVLRFGSGVRMTDKLMIEKRRDDRDYLDYVTRTPAFVPRPRSRTPRLITSSDERNVHST
jgi:steroid 5-alpha reductase family enzyme